MIIIPSGAVRMIEKTAVVKMSLPHLTYLSLLSCARMKSSGSEARAACTVAFGIQAKATNNRSINVSGFLPPVTAKKAIGSRMARPMQSKPMDFGMVDGVTSLKFTAAPMTPKSKG